MYPAPLPKLDGRMTYDDIEHDLGRHPLTKGAPRCHTSRTHQVVAWQPAYSKVQAGAHDPWSDRRYLFRESIFVTGLAIWASVRNRFPRPCLRRHRRIPSFTSDARDAFEEMEAEQDENGEPDFRLFDVTVWVYRSPVVRASRVDVGLFRKGGR